MVDGQKIYYLMHCLVYNDLQEQRGIEQRTQKIMYSIFCALNSNYAGEIFALLSTAWFNASWFKLTLLGKYCWRYAGWPHRHGGWLACWRLEDRFPAKATLIYTMHEGVQGVLPMRVGGATSQLYLPSLTPLSVADCGRLQLGVPHWAASVDYCK